MQKIAIIQISEAGSAIATHLQQHFPTAVIISRDSVATHWKQFDAFVFIGAMGICVRTIAPLIKDKHEDPAVVCVDSLGKNAIAVLSGHVGGANDLTRDIASTIGARKVITTQSDNAGLWALDTFEQRFDWPVASDIDDMNQCIFAFVNRQRGRPTEVSSPHHRLALYPQCAPRHTRTPLCADGGNDWLRTGSSP